MTMVGRWFSKIASWFTGPEFDEDIEKIRLATVRVCGFLPTVGTVANILAAGNPALMGATAIAGAICAALTRKKSMAALYGDGGVATVEGIVIEGEWVK
jgi:hypothetical protein